MNIDIVLFAGRIVLVALLYIFLFQKSISLYMITNK